MKMTEDKIDIKCFIHNCLEGILFFITPEGVKDPYSSVAKIIAKKYEITQKLFKCVHHSFHWYLTDKKIMLLDDLE